jgi:hypothetical protein
MINAKAVVAQIEASRFMLMFPPFFETKANSGIAKGPFQISG